MIETIYNGESNEEEPVKIPKNIHQIGDGEGKYHIYIEDKVTEFLKLLPENEKNIRYGILLGNARFSRGEVYLFIHSVVEVRDMLDNTLLFGDDVWTGIYDEIKKYYHSEKTFDTLEHKKAWLIVTASNQCKDMLKHWWRQRKNIEDYKNVLDDNSTKTDEMLAIIIELPDKYKTSIYLYYYEGYNSREIAQILKKPESTIRTYLQKAKKMIRKEIETE